MNLADIARLRLYNQQIATSRQKTAKGVVAWMGAMQAQDFPMAKWAVGVRCPHATMQTIDAAIDKGEIVRTHVLRPTWHLVSANDIHWMLELTAPHVRSSLRSRHKELGLSDDVVARSHGILEKALRDEKHRFRDELVAELEKARIPTNENRAAHLLLLAELDRIVCSGASRRGKPTYALLHERIPGTKSLTREEGLARLARRYFASHSPATLRDFSWWSGLTAANVRQALELVKGDLTSEKIGAHEYWFSDSTAVPDSLKEEIHLLPAYDEFLISYADRTASLSSKNLSRTVSSNGIFRPVVVVDGQVAGIWKRTTMGERVIVEFGLFKKPGVTTTSLIEKAVVRYSRFLGKHVETRYRS